MSRKKNHLIKIAQTHIVRHEENLSYEEKVLYNKIRHIVLGQMTPEQIALTMLKQMSRAKAKEVRQCKTKITPQKRFSPFFNRQK